MKTTVCGERSDHYSCESREGETRIARTSDPVPDVWFEAAGYTRLRAHPRGRPIWAAASGSSILLFRLEEGAMAAPA